jgi:hypothetical protein
MSGILFTGIKLPKLLVHTPGFLLMSLLLQTAAEAAQNGPHFPTSFVLVYVVGFIAAVTIGSIAWYNSKRPPGWENKGRPDTVPKVDAGQTKEANDPNA